MATLIWDPRKNRPPADALSLDRSHHDVFASKSTPWGKVTFTLAAGESNMWKSCANLCNRAKTCCSDQWTSWTILTESFSASDRMCCIFFHLNLGLWWRRLRKFQVHMVNACFGTRPRTGLLFPFLFDSSSEVAGEFVGDLLLLNAKLVDHRLLPL